MSSALPSLPYLLVMLFDRLLPEFNADFLESIADEFLHMEPVVDLFRIRETDGGDLRHTIIQVVGHSLHRFPFAERYSLDSSNHCFGLRSLNNGDETSLFPVSLLVRKDGVEFAAAHLRFIDAQVCSDVLRKDEPVLGVILLFPTEEVAQMITVQTNEIFRVEKVCFGDGGEGNRLGVSLVLLKNQRTPSPIGYRGQRAR